jgi:hypothetical protein
MTYMKNIVPLAAVALLLVSFVPSAKAVDGSEWLTPLTISEPLQVGNLLLSPGTYILQRYSGNCRSVVMIYNLDHNRWDGMIFGVPFSRTGAADRSSLEIYRGAQGTHRELRFWFRSGWGTGIEFPSASGSSGSTTLLQGPAPVETARLSQ